MQLFQANLSVRVLRQKVRADLKAKGVQSL